METLGGKNAEELWQDYLFLTRELNKFLQAEDFDMFNSLMAQRETLQASIGSIDNKAFRVTPSGRAIISEAVKINQAMNFTLRRMLNREKRQQTVNNAYDGIGIVSVGRRTDWQG